MTPPIAHLVKPLDALLHRLDRRAPGRPKSRGIAIIEFAFILPFVFILFFSIVDFGIFFFDQHTLQFATREGARVGLTGRQLVDAGGNTMSREQSIVKTIQDFAGIAVDPAKLSISIYPISSTYADPAGWNGTQDAGPPGAIMRVRTQYTFKFITPFVAQVMNNGALVIQAEATYKNESF